MSIDFWSINLNNADKDQKTALKEFLLKLEIVPILRSYVRETRFIVKTTHQLLELILE